MKSRRFVLFAGLSFAAVSLSSCAQKPIAQQSTAPENPASPQAEPLPTAASSPPQAQTAPTAQTTSARETALLSSGSFVSGEHPTQGTVRLVNQAGKHRLELDQTFSTSTSGPDLVVILHRSPDVIGSTTPPAFPIQEGDYVLLAPLKSYSGAQSYEVSDNINLNEFKSAAIWCRQFNATFGAATLKPA